MKADAATEVMFYHLVDQPVEVALCDLLEKSLQRGWRVCVQSNNPEHIAKLDSHLWEFRRDSFLPHAADGNEKSETQPIWLTAESSNPNSAQVRFMIDLAHLDAPEQYERICYMFDGLDQDQLGHARAAWKQLKADGLALTYWQQTQGGGWEKKATS